MIITNRLNLPHPLVELAKSEEEFGTNEYRVTSLLKGVREVLLERRHRSMIEQDVSDMIWLLFGTAVHSVLETQQETDTQLKEERIKIPVDEYILSGKFDLYDDLTGVVHDYKTASVWKIIYGDFSDWRRQTLIYCWLLRQIGFNARSGQITALLKDHSKREAKLKSEYPQFPVYPVRFDYTDEDFEECGQWIKERFDAIRKNEHLPDDQLPVCTPEERWNSGDKYAVMKKGVKTAKRVLNSQAEAEQWMEINGGDYIEKRPGEDKKCAEYCSACAYCNYYKGRCNDGQPGIV